MSRKFRPKTGCILYKVPRRGEIWLVVDRNDPPKEETQQYNNSIQRGTRLCVVVSNDTGNLHSPVVEIIYLTTKQKNGQPTHFPISTAPRPSIGLCEQIMTVPKKDLTEYYGTLTMKEKCQMDKCLKISLGL